MKLSVITINKNNASGLESTIRSVIEQTFAKIEYIIIDGASFDNSNEIIDKYKKKISFSISEPDTGVYNAMNKGIEKASGDYCMFLNSGDTLVNENVIQKMISYSDREDIIFGNIVKVDGVKFIVDKGIGHSNITFFDLFLGTINHGSSLIKRDLFNIYGKYSESLKVVSDWEFFLKAVGLGKATVRYVDIDVTYFDLSGISNQNLEYYLSERKPILEALVPPRILDDYNRFYQDIILFKELNSSLIFKIIFKFLKSLKKA